MKTAVEWLVEQLMPKALSAEQFYCIQQAKEMEKEQIIETYNKAHSDGYKDIDKFGEQYYNKTFKSE
jgi:hypothetical protein